MQLENQIRNTKLFKNAKYFQAYINMCFEFEQNYKKACNYSTKDWCYLFGSDWSRQNVRTFVKFLLSENLISYENSKIIYPPIPEIEQKVEQQPKTETLPEAQKKIQKAASTKTWENKKLTEIQKDELPETMQKYIDITIAFQQLFRKNLEEINVSTQKIDNAKCEWIKHIKYIIENDNYTIEDLQDVFFFLQDEIPNNNFAWKHVILSTKKLREKLTDIIIKSRVYGSKKRQGFKSNMQHNRDSRKTTTADIHELISRHAEQYNT